MALVRGGRGRGGDEGAREPPGEGEAVVEGVEDADGEGDGFEGEVGAAEDCLDERDRGRCEGGGGGNEVDEVDGRPCSRVVGLADFRTHKKGPQAFGKSR